MKAVIKVELTDKKGTVSDQISVEAPTIAMLKDTVTRTMLLQMTDLLKQVFECAETVKEATSDKPKPGKKAAADRAGG